MESTFVGRGVAAPADDDLIAALHFDAEAGAGRDGIAAADDGVGAQVALGEVGDMHGAAAALAVAVALTHQLAHGIVQARALCDAVAVAAVGRRDIVLVCDEVRHGRRRGFFTNTEMDGSSEDILLEEIHSCHFKLADPIHQKQCIQILLFGHVHTSKE